jgi:hypothetical protein
MYKLKTLLVGLVLVVAAACSNTPLFPAATETSAVNAAWKEACQLSRYSCLWVKRPEVAYSDVLGNGVRGAFWPGSTRVWLAKGIDIQTNIRDYGTLVHEFVHYLQEQNFQWPAFSKTVQCQREEEAWDVFNLLMKKYDREDLVDVRWRYRYGC